MFFIITGQTATGKTELALELAKKYDGEIINCDSRQIYKLLDIITGKDINSKEKFNLVRKLNNFDIGYYSNLYTDNVPIWLYDIVDPKRLFTAVEYRKCALWAINNIVKRGKTPIVVGGTYFYLQNLLYETIKVNIPPNQKLRKELENKTLPELQVILNKLSSNLFNNLNNSEKNNPQRLIRKIEIKLSQQSIQSYTPEKKTNKSEKDSRLKIFKKYPQIKFIGLKFKHKEDLEKIVKSRVEKRLNRGAIPEVEKLLKNGYTKNDPGLKTIGYQQIIKYLKGQASKEESITEWIIKEIQYAKKQHTFMKRDKNIQWREI